MSYYMMLLRNESIDFGAYSPEEMHKIMADFDVWNAQMIAGERLIASGSLQGGEGKTLRAGNVIADGPYGEVKEAVMGFLLIQAQDIDEATEIALGCPFLPRGGSVELRHVPQLEFEDAAGPILASHAAARELKLAGGS